jgi:hypothetical protein
VWQPSGPAEKCVVMRNLVYALLEEFVWRLACRASDQGSYGSAAHSPWSLNRYLRIVQVEFSKREAVRYTQHGMMHGTGGRGVEAVLQGSAQRVPEELASARRKI